MSRTPTRFPPSELLMLGHDVRTVLADVSGSLDRLVAGCTDPRCAGDLHRLKSAAKNLSDIVASATTPPPADHSPWGPVDLAAVCSETIDSLSTLAGDHAVQLTCELAGAPTELAADRASLRRLLSCLITNACVHSGGASVTVRARELPGRPRRIELSVFDDGRGLGIGLEANPGAHGGLGLLICRSIAAAHGGWLEARTAKGRGTTLCAVLRADLPEPRSGESPADIHIVDEDVVAAPLLTT